MTPSRSYAAAWKSCELGEVITLQRGHDLPKQSRGDGEIPIISSSGITGYHNESKAEGPGVVTGRYGTLGEVFFVDGEYWPLNTTLFVTNFKGNDPLFVSYFLKTLDLARFNGAGAVPGLNRNQLHKISIRFPPDADLQKQIVTFLKRFDDLIENNQRRIALLQEAALQLYREWFVRLRFPGHESTIRNGGIPADWKKRALAEIAPLVYGKALKATDRVDGYVPVYGSSGVVGTHANQLVDGPGIIIGRKGTVGSVYWESKPFWPIDTVYFVEPSKVDLFIFYALRTIEFISSDVAVPGLNRSYAHRITILVPDQQTKVNFLNIAKPIHDQLNNLHQQNTRLTEARDLLLPRLMSGEIKV